MTNPRLPPEFNRWLAAQDTATRALGLIDQVGLYAAQLTRESVRNRGRAECDIPRVVDATLDIVSDHKLKSNCKSVKKKGRRITKIAKEIICGH